MSGVSLSGDVVPRVAGAVRAFATRSWPCDVNARGIVDEAVETAKDLDRPVFIMQSNKTLTSAFAAPARDRNKKLDVACVRDGPVVEITGDESILCPFLEETYALQAGVSSAEYTASKGRA